MNKNEVLRMVNRNLNDNIKVREKLYKGKVFVVTKNGRIDNAFF